MLALLPPPLKKGHPLIIYCNQLVNRRHLDCIGGTRVEKRRGGEEDEGRRRGRGRGVSFDPWAERVRSWAIAFAGPNVG